MNQRISRRSALKLGAGALLAAGAWPGVLRAADARAEDFEFLVVNDLHFFDKNCPPFFERVVASMRALKARPEFCLIVGDLADGGTAEQLGMCRDVFKPLGLDLHVVVGNHDHQTDTDRKAYEKIWADSINYTFEHRGWQFVGLDTSQGTKSSVTVQKPTLDWLGENVPKVDKKRPTVVFTHFPLGAKAPLRPTNADDVLTPFEQVNLRAVFNGHYHGYTESTLREAKVTTNRCCSLHRNNHDQSKQKGYFLVRAREGVVAREFVEVVSAGAATQPATRSTTRPA